MSIVLLLRAGKDPRAAVFKYNYALFMFPDAATSCAFWRFHKPETSLRQL